MFEWIKLRWSVFSYNFTWDDYSEFLNGYAAKASFLVPIIGYAVLFNDYVTDHLEFENLTNEVKTTFFLDSESRVRFIFFGFLLLAAANTFYRIFRPYAIKVSETSQGYADYFLKYGTAGTFLRLHQEIHHSKFDPLTIDGKYYTDDWDLFWQEASWAGSGKNELIKEDRNQKLVGYDRVNFSEAKKRHENVLLSILRETYFRESRKRRPLLVICLTFATVGYLLLLIPSIDLLLRVLQLTIWDPLIPYLTW
ncbi:hypothetical protein RXV86_02870 [Alisedimentitalea sp. MJ-SS2]|uniref:hypothetical protein n=1 Tax=Aliisedimentitalea sp. MJ-SS2 TaxID=3049795 RepID=UPI00290AAC22|nr:hypothetical protein [Alisedimentitalea sp. MJ-SS2]MDU8926317.1 hypothetical protein [Alisedimentitalea sp. MJ-SS2]